MTKLKIILVLLPFFLWGCPKDTSEPTPVVEETSVSNEEISEPADYVDRAESLELEPIPVEEFRGHPYTISENSSTLSFVASKVTRSHEGGFKQFGGMIDAVNNAPESSTIYVNIDMASLWTDTAKLTHHLREDDFFAVDQFPTGQFRSTAITPRDDGSYDVTGSLTIHGVTKEVSFRSSIAMDEELILADAELVIDRTDFDITYPGMVDDLIKDEVTISYHIVANPNVESSKETELSEGEGEY